MEQWAECMAPSWNARAWITAGNPIKAVEAHAAEAGRTGISWRHGMTFWCGFGSDRGQARDHVAPVMENLYRLPFAKFERFVPCGSPAQVAEFIAPFVKAGAGTVNLIPFADSDEAGIDAVADVRQQLLSAF
jgi:alkanesulfonate monooxygenase SsuD/methylene tetrahydromethanopterin reductase-like flavin-dependent oxidoreductase (luciferase family)